MNPILTQPVPAQSIQLREVYEAVHQLGATHESSAEFLDWLESRLRSSLPPS